MINVTPFRVTSEDLAGLDRKTQEGIQPLLDALNVTLRQVVQALQVQPQEQLVPISLRTGASVASSFPLVFKHTVTQPKFVSMVCNPSDPNHVMTAPFVMQGFGLTDGGLVSVPFITGLLANNSYQLAFLVRS